MTNLRKMVIKRGKLVGSFAPSVLRMDLQFAGLEKLSLSTDFFFCDLGFDEEDEEGFQFTRVAPKKARSSLDAIPKLNPSIENTAPQPSPKRGRPRKKRLDVGNDGAEDAEVQTPEVGVKKSTRSTRKAAPIEPEPEPESVPRSTRKQTRAEAAAPARQHDQPEPGPGDKKRKKGRPAKSKPEERNGFVSPEPQTAKISLPMADTPVMQKNKEMRTKKSEKGNRRSSLGMRGRRASSLIDSGASNGRHIYHV